MVWCTMYIGTLTSCNYSTFNRFASKASSLPSICRDIPVVAAGRNNSIFSGTLSNVSQLRRPQLCSTSRQDFCTSIPSLRSDFALTIPSVAIQRTILKQQRSGDLILWSAFPIKALVHMSASPCSNTRSSHSWINSFTIIAWSWALI